MITKREKLQYGYLFLTDLLSLVLSIGLAWGLTAGVLHKMVDFQLDDNVRIYVPMDLNADIIM